MKDLEPVDWRGLVIPTAITILLGIVIVVLVVVMTDRLAQTDLKTSDMVSGRNMSDCGDPIYQNMTNIGDSYYCLYENRTMFCKVDGKTYVHLKPATFCEGVYIG
jgi:hypothetical protein